jgi:CheY-like chemotaxis protein
MGKTLLLADDSVTIQKVVGISFASEDITLVTVDNGDDAIARARALRPDVILADVVMPGKSGYEVCEAINADPALRHIPVLLLTGTFEAFDAERASRAGAAGHIAKPFEAQALVERVKRLLAAAPAPAAPQQSAAAPAAPQKDRPAPQARPASPAAPPAKPAAAPQAAPALARPAAPAPSRAPAAVAAPAGPPAAPARPSTASDEAFDFFDDSVAEPAQSARTATADSQLGDAGASDASLELDADDSAFAFGDEDLASTPSAPARNRAAAHTVAILPDAPPEESSPGLALEADADDDAELELATPRPGAPPENLMAGAEDAEAFDFEFENTRGGGRDADVAPATTVLDPIAGSEYDVSSSDLSAMAAPAATRLMEPPSPAPTRVAEEPVMDLLEGDLDDKQDDWAADPAERTLERVAPAAAPPPPAPSRTPSPPRAAAPTPTPAARPRAPISEPAQTGARISDAALERIAPALKAQIHETLEKIAWEAFGRVAETIIEQAVERLEKAAWEVVPRLAETLILEEIRRIKGEPDEE